MPDQNGLQLLPETRRKIEIITPGENRFLFVGTTVLVMVIVLVGGLYFYKNSLENKLVSLDAEISALEKSRNKEAEQNILIFNKQILMLSDLLNKHVYWTTAFSKIEGLTQNQVQFNSVTATLTNTRVDFKATAANYTTVARQIAAFLSDESITDINLNKITSLTNGQLEFTMQIIFDRSKFLTSK